jgi:hypothetical protein
VRLETPLRSLTFRNRFPNQGKLYDLKFPAIALSSSSPFLSVPLSTIPCSSVGFSLPTELSYSTLRCGVASIGYISDPFFFTLPAFDWNGTALFNSGLPSFRTLHPDRLPIDRRDRFSYSVVAFKSSVRVSSNVVAASPEQEIVSGKLRLSYPLSHLPPSLLRPWMSSISTNRPT